MTVHSGIPMSEESYKEWEQSFIDIELSIKEIYKDESDIRSEQNAIE